MTTALRRRAYLAVIVVCLVAALAVGAVWMLRTHEHLAGTDSVEPASFIANVMRGERFCESNLLVPGNADKIRFDLTPSAGTQPVVQLTLTTVAGVRSTSSRTLMAPGYVDFPIERIGRSSGGTACLRPSRLITVTGYGGARGTIPTEAFLQGKPVAARASVWFWDTHKRALASLLPTAARRASVFRAGFVGAWTYLVALLLIPFLWWLGLRTLLRGVE